MKPVAPWWHTVILVVVFLSIAFGGVFLRHGTLSASEPRPDVIPMYVSLILVEWGLFFFIWKGGLRRSGTPLRELIGGSWGSPRRFLIDLTLGIGLWGLWTLADRGWDRLFGAADVAAIEKVLPNKPVEVALWILLSVSAGFCEEVAFRGYFQRQFAFLTRHVWTGLLLQAALFGISHGYQGLRACLEIALYGVLFTLLALWRRSLRPGMMAHAWTDILAGLFRI